MISRFLIILFLSTCACKTRAQVWTNFINAVPNIGPPDVYCMVADTASQTLYIGGGAFANSFGQFTTNCIVKFDGVNFDTLQSGIDDYFPGNFSSQVRNMVMYKNKLYVFGNFFKAGKNYTKKMAAWNGISWDTLKATGNNAPDFAYILNDEMYVWGLDSINGMKINGLARFDGTNWYDVPTPQTPGHTASYVVSFQGKLYKSGQVTPSSSDANLSYSDGTNWIPWVGISGNNNKAVFGMKVIDTLMFVYGRFYSIAGTQCAGLAAYNGKQWYGFGQGLSTDQGWETVENIQKIGNDLYITGLFNKIEGIANSNFPAGLSTNLAKFDGQKWCIISPPFNNVVLGVVKFNGDLYAYGGFEKIGNDSIRSFGKYNGGFNSICSQSVTITMSTIGLHEIIEFENFKLFPNPTKDKLTLEFSISDGSVAKLELINSTGQIVNSFESKNHKQEIDLSVFSNGIYFLKIQTQSGQKIIKVVKE